MRSRKIYFGIMNCMVWFAVMLTAAHADTGKENPWGLFGTPAQTTNCAWVRYPIEGFAWPTSVKPGETLKFYVSVKDTLGQLYKILLFRIPETLARDSLVNISGNFYPLRAQNGDSIYPGDINPPKPVDFKIGCTSFWESGAVAFTIPASWPSGLYYARLRHLSLPDNHPYKYYYVPFVVRAAIPGSTSKILFKFDLNTSQAYTTWGGGSLYSYRQDSLSLTPTDTLALDRPLSWNYSLGFRDFATSTIQFLESNGYLIEYCNNIDADSLGASFLGSYKMLVIWNHDEYWSTNERRNTETFKGVTYNGNIARFAPNTCFWRVNWIGTGHQKFYCRKGPNYWPPGSGTHDPNDLWRDITYGPGEPEAKFLGEQYEKGFNIAGEEPPDSVKYPNHWIFRNANIITNAFGYGFVDPAGQHGIVSGEVDNLNTGRADFPIDILAQRFVLSNVDGDTLPVLHQMIFYEDTLSNARVLASGAGGWNAGMHDLAIDLATMRQITLNIFDHFSFRKYRGNIYANILIWGDETLETATILDGDTDILANKTLNLTGNFTLTINPDVTLYVDGTLIIGKNVTITGGGQIVPRGSGKILVTNSATALASNNSRKLARDVIGNYHLVFETEGEVCYEKMTTSGATTEFRRLSNGVADGVKSSPCIYVRDNNILVVWQKNTGSSHDITFHKSTDYGATWSTSNRKVIAGAVGSNLPLPVIVSPATNQLMVVYRTATNLSYQTSSDYGSTWSAKMAVPSSGVYGNSPTLALTSTYWSTPRTALVNATEGGIGTIFYRYYKNGDSTGWASLLKNLSQIVPGTYTGHQKPSLAPSGTSSSQTLHVAWEATQGSTRVIIHRKATDWATWPNVYSRIYTSFAQQQLPSITGLANAAAELLFQDVNVNDIYKIYYDGAAWGGELFVSTGTNPSVSIGNTTAKYVWRYGSAAPYEIKTSTETLNKTSGKQLALNYHRSIAVIDTTTNNWLEVRLDKLAVKTKVGEQLAVPFADAKEDTNTLTPTHAFTNLASTSFTVPADAESLLVSCQVNGQGLSTIKTNANALGIEIVLLAKNKAAIKLPVLTTTSENLPATAQTFAIALSNLAGSELSLATQVSGISEKSSLIASLGHIYEIVESSLPKVLGPVAENTAPQDYALSAYPNPFPANGTFGNPSMQIYFVMKEAGLATVRIFNLTGQLVRELVNEYRVGGEHTVPWDGRDHRGARAASGVYFIRFAAGDAVKINKAMLVR